MDNTNIMGRRLSENRLRTCVCAAMILLALLLTTICAAAIEAPTGATEVKIPISLKATDPIAGAEIAFKQTEGLGFLRYEPASGLGNPTKATAGGKIWVGFFSDENKYSPDAGKIEIGNLVFAYAGDAEEQVTISDVKLHRLMGLEEVESRASQPNTGIAVTRQSVSAGEKQNGNSVTLETVNAGNTDSKESAAKTSSKTGSSKSNSADASASGTGGASATTKGSAAGTAAVAEIASDGALVADAIDESMVPFTKDESLEYVSDDGSAIPLASESGQGQGTNRLILLFVAALLGVGAIFFPARKKMEKRSQRKQES